jgi:hypothetical protein
MLGSSVLALPGREVKGLFFNLGVSVDNVTVCRGQQVERELRVERAAVDCHLSILILTAFISYDF